MHKTFKSYYHDSEQEYKDYIITDGAIEIYKTLDKNTPRISKL